MKIIKAIVSIDTGELAGTVCLQVPEDLSCQDPSDYLSLSIVFCAVKSLPLFIYIEWSSEEN